LKLNGTHQILVYTVYIYNVLGGSVHTIKENDRNFGIG
jgi:hypothetical protein